MKAHAAEPSRPHLITTRDRTQETSPGTRIALTALGAAALWIALVAGLDQVSVHVFGMVTGDAWAFAIGIVTYIFLFAGLVLGLVFALRNEQ